MNFHQFIYILWSRKAIALLALILTVMTAIIISLGTSKEYVATTSVVIDQDRMHPVTGQALSAQLMPGYMATQVDVISSHYVARKVVEKLNLAQNPTFRKGYEKSGETGDIKDWIANILLTRHLEVRPSRESSIIQIDFSDGDPQFAAKGANAFADAYIDTSIELRAQPAKLTADWYDLQMASFREKLEHAQSVLSDYEQRYGIIVTENHLDLENDRLSQLSKQLMESHARTGELESRENLLESTSKRNNALDSLQEVLNSTLIQTLKSDLAKAEASFAELSKQLDVNHPKYKQTQAQISSLQNKIQSETAKVLSNIKSGAAASSRRDRLIAKELADQKNKVLELKKQYDEIAVYKREVENSQRAYDTVIQKAIQSRLESEISQTNISILNPALTPYKPTKPKLLLNIIVSIFLGSLLAIGAALIAELLDRRVRSTFDISETLNIPVFGVVSASK